MLPLQKLRAEISLGTEKSDQIVKDKYSLRAYRDVATTCFRVQCRVLCFQKEHAWVLQNFLHIFQVMRFLFIMIQWLQS